MVCLTHLIIVYLPNSMGCVLWLILVPWCLIWWSRGWSSVVLHQPISVYILSNCFAVITAADHSLTLMTSQASTLSTCWKWATALPYTYWDLAPLFNWKANRSLSLGMSSIYPTSWRYCCFARLFLVVIKFVISWVRDMATISQNLILKRVSFS